MTPRLDRAVDRGLGARHQLLDVGVVGRLARSDDRHRRVVDDGVALREEQQVRCAADRRVAIGGAGDLPALAGSVNSRGYAQSSVGSGPCAGVQPGGVMIVAESSTPSLRL